MLADNMHIGIKRNKNYKYINIKTILISIKVYFYAEILFLLHHGKEINFR